MFSSRCRMFMTVVMLLTGLLGAGAVSAADSANKGMLVITSSPGGAKIYIDGARKGTTPKQPGKDLALELAEGEYRLEAVLDDGLTLKASESVYVPGNGIQPAHLILRPMLAMVSIPAGSFRMGCVSGRGCKDHEKPVHTVQLSAFEIGQYEVTFAEWDACVADGGCAHKPDDQGWGRGQRPVINVSWDDAQSYLGWLSGKTGRRYRLPSEAEWEYAARAGTSDPFSFDDPITPDKANYNGNHSFEGSPKGVYREKTLPVGSFRPNAWGLYDVHGNVWEWVADCWHHSYAGAPADGSAWQRGNCQRRVLRGGSWNNNPRNLRAANRNRNDTGNRNNNNGFRVASTLLYQNWKIHGFFG